QIERPLNPLVEDRVRAHLNADKRRHLSGILSRGGRGGPRREDVRPPRTHGATSTAAVSNRDAHGITMGIKVAISLPDDVYRAADRLEARQKKPRSRLYAEALELYLARHDGEAVTEALNSVADAMGTALEPDLASASTHILKRSVW